MGLFSFLKRAGSKILGGGSSNSAVEVDRTAEEAENREKASLLKSVVESQGFRVTNLDVEYDGDKATVYGEVSEQSDREKIVLALGNVSGVSVVDDRMSVTNPKPEARFYEVKKGDSLSKISKEMYGDPMKYQQIFEANQPMLKNMDLIYPGQVLRIPAL